MKRLIISCFIGLCALSTLAQDNLSDSTIYVVTRHDGVEYIGYLLSDDDRELLLETKLIGRIYIPKSEVRSIMPITDKKEVRNDEYYFLGPFTTRYSFTTNAMPIKKGENYGMLNLYGPEAHLALTNRWNVGVMTTWIGSPILLATKYSFKEEEATVNYSFGTLFGTMGYLNNFNGYAGLHWLNVTFGDRRKNLTLAGGYAYMKTGASDLPPGVYVNEEYWDNNNYTTLDPIRGPIVSVACIFRIGARASFVFDSMIGTFKYTSVYYDYDYDYDTDISTYIISYEDKQAVAMFFMSGVRFQNTDRRAFQICIAGVSTFGDIEMSFPVPMCTWFYKF